MFVIKKLETLTCATCNKPISLGQLNGITFQLESEAVVSANTVVLVIHKCFLEGPKPAGPRPKYVH